MARASRSKQPAFDPNELNDLIFSPAVGTGVGSHLLAKTEAFPSRLDLRDEPESILLNVSTVDTLRVLPSDGPVSDLQPAATIIQQLEALTGSPIHVTTVATSHPDRESAPLEKMLDMPTVDMLGPTTVVTSSMTTVDRFSDTWEDWQRPGRESADLPTVDTSKVEPRSYSAKVKLWITEEGNLIPEGRVKRIRVAQDVINSGEESVYDTLWKSPAGEDRDTFRVVQAGYDYLSKRTRLARKTIQRIVAKLIDKDFIQIERPADIYERTATVYRVFSYRAVLDRHMQRGRTHVAKVGPGFSYVQPVDNRTFSRADSDLSTVATTDLSTVGNESTLTVVKMNLSTVVRETTSLLGREHRDKTTSAVHAALSTFGTVDDDALTRLIQNCRDQASDCTDLEIVHFIQEKGRLVKARGSKIQNPIGFLIDSVPKCFTGESFRAQRAAAAALDRGREVAPPISRTDELQKTCWLLREMPKSVNAGRWQELLMAAKDDHTVSDDLRALIGKVLAGAE